MAEVVNLRCYSALRSIGMTVGQAVDFSRQNYHLIRDEASFGSHDWVTTGYSELNGMSFFKIFIDDFPQLWIMPKIKVSHEFDFLTFEENSPISLTAWKNIEAKARDPT